MRMSAVSTVCDVCGKPQRDLRVCSSGLGPASFAYCTECVRRNAEPLMILVARVFFAGGPGATFEPEVLNAVTHDGTKYVGLGVVLEQYDELHHRVRSAFGIGS